MTAKFSCQDVLSITNGRLVIDSGQNVCGRITWKLEEVKAGDWFISIGSGFYDIKPDVKKAIENGACGLIVGDQVDFTILPNDIQSCVIAVKDVKASLIDLMTAWRSKVNPKVIAVTGGSGRRSTMVLLHEFLKENSRIHLAFMKNLSWFGCISSILDMPIDTEVLVFEAGAIETGDVARISKPLKPQIGVITRLQEEIAVLRREVSQVALYCEVIETIDKSDNNACIVINDEFESTAAYLREISIDYKTRLFSKASSADLKWLRENDIEAISEAMMDAIGSKVKFGDLWCAIEAAKAFGLTQGKIAEFFADPSPVIR